MSDHKAGVGLLGSVRASTVMRNFCKQYGRQMPVRSRGVEPNSSNGGYS